MIICLEGIDACGKGTHTELLAKRMGARVWKFPNKETITGKLIYAHLDRLWRAQPAKLGEWSAQYGNLLDPLVFQALQVANRMEVATELFEVASRGNVVLDRYWPSGYAYGRADGLDGDYLIGLHRWLPQPDLFILLDVDEKDSAERRPDRRDRYEKAASFMPQVAGFYRELWDRQRAVEPTRWVVVNARGTQEETAAQINAAVAAAREHRAG